MNMENQDQDWTDIPDETLGKQLELFESQLLCPICQDLYDNPQMLKCGHSFCSLCIRRNCDQTLNRTTNDICPTCREKAELYDARKNVVLSSIILQYKEMKQRLYTKLSHENPSSPERESSHSILNGRDYQGIKGKAITSKVSHPHLHGATKDKVRKFIDTLLKESKIKLNMDGDKETLERRLRDLIHLMNAQVDADHPLSLDAVVKKINDSESARNKRTPNAEALLSTSSFKRSFSDLSQQALEHQKKMKEKSLTQREEEIEGKEEPKASEPEQQSASANRWRVVLSSATQKPFYYDTIKKIGQFDVPPDFQLVTANEVSNDSNPDGITEIEETSPDKSVKVEKFDLGSEHKMNDSEDAVIVIDSTENSRVEAPLMSQSQIIMTPSSQATDSWSCSACTYLNVATADVCAICETKNDRKRPRRSTRKSQMKLSL